MTAHDFDSIKPQHDQLEHQLAESLQKYDQERNKTLSISDSTALLVSEYFRLIKLEYCFTLEKLNVYFIFNLKTKIIFLRLILILVA